MPLPVGSWNIDANGADGTLVIGTASSGNFSGTVFGQPFTGFFDETNQEFSFIRVMGTATTFPYISTAQVYYGTLFSYSPVGGTTDYTLAGTFRTYPPSGGDTPPYEWWAQLQQKTKEKEGKDGGKDKEASKDTKDAKDRKDTKEGAKEVEKIPKDKEHEAMVQQPMAMEVDQLSQRVAAVEQALAVGQAFISPSERPAVGGQATGRRKS